MTEKEAKTKWCPMTRITPDAMGGFINNKNYNGVITYCIASDCMMWRWIHFENISDQQFYDIVKGKDGAMEKQGYCGLGGNT